MNRSGQHRDMVFCHQCENEWYRDEHGLMCPGCHSEFTEIIERDHDPRQERFQHADDDDDDIMPGLSHMTQHSPWRDIPDPEEDDIEHIRLGDRYRDRSRTPSRFDVPDDDPLAHNFATMLQGIAGRPPMPRSMPDSPSGGHRHGTRNLRHGPHMEIRREGPNASFYFSSSYSSSPSMFGGGRRDQNDPMPPGINDLMSQMFSELGQPSRPRNQGEPSSTDMPPLNPIQMLLQTFLGPPGGIAGDAVYSQEAFDRVMSQLMELNQTGTAPGPASAEAIAALPTKKVDKSMLDDQGKAECSICMDEVKLNDQVSRLPCNHWFHPDCIKAWLNEHDTCPHCREGIMPKNDGSSRRPSVSVRSPDQPPLHSQNPWSPGHRGSGAQEYPWHADSPRSSRRPPSESRRNSSGRSSAHSRRSVSGPDGGGGSGLTDRMRNIFGGSSSRH